VPAPTTIRKYAAVEDEHQRREIAELAAEADCLIAATDSGAKGDAEWCPQFVSFYREQDDVIVQLLLDVPVVLSTQGADLANAQLRSWAAAGLDLQAQTTMMSDSCASMTGKHKGAVQRVRVASGNRAVVAARCLAHLLDLVLRSALLAMSWLAKKWCRPVRTLVVRS
jgi:hypothetical protein